jgi:hypothetical protein
MIKSNAQLMAEQAESDAASRALTEAMRDWVLDCFGENSYTTKVVLMCVRSEYEGGFEQFVKDFENAS